MTLSKSFGRYTTYVLLQYAAGEDLGVVEQRVLRTTQIMRKNGEAMRANEDTRYAQICPLEASMLAKRRVVYAYLALARKEGFAEEFSALLSPVPAKREYFCDLMAKTFIASFKLLKKYAPDKDAASFVEPLPRVIAKPAAERPAALAAI